MTETLILNTFRTLKISSFFLLFDIIENYSICSTFPVVFSIYISRNSVYVCLFLAIAYNIHISCLHPMFSYIKCNFERSKIDSFFPYIIWSF